MEENTVAIIDNSFNIFENMPEELVDEIFKHCAINSNNDGSKHYVQYKIHDDTLVIFEYIGDMGDQGLPHGRGSMTSASNYDIVPYSRCQSNNVPLNNNTETIWLYVPFFYIFKNYKPTFTNFV